MASKVIHLTEAGLQKIKNELDHLRSVERPAISAAIAEARDKGDLSENAEYDAAKEAQGMLEMRIAKLEEMVANARVIDESGKLSIGTPIARALLGHKKGEKVDVQVPSGVIPFEILDISIG